MGTFKFGSYNVQTLLDNRILELIAGCDETKMDIIAIQEHRWTTTVDIEVYHSPDNKWIFIHTTAKDGQGGIGILMREPLSYSISDMEKINNRILKITLHGSPAITIISAYAPHGGYQVQERQLFYKSLHDTLQGLPTHHIKLVGGDLNAEIGKDKHQQQSNVCGPNYFYEKGTIKNWNGDLLLQLCESQNMRIVQSFFKHPHKHMWTHRRPNGQLVQLDHILINRKWFKSITNCRTYNSPEINSDHKIVVAHVKITLKAYNKNKRTPQVDWNSLSNTNISTRFQNVITAKLTNTPNIPDPQGKYNNLISAIQTAGNILPKISKGTKRKLVSDQTDAIRKARNKAQSDMAKNKTADNKIKVVDLNKQLRDAYKKDQLTKQHRERSHGFSRS